MSQAIGTAIVKFITGATSVNAIVANVVGTAALMVGSNLLTPKARFGNVKERDSLNIRGINSRGSTDSRSYIYGQVRVGGTVVYMETTGTDNEFLHMVLVHCDHEVEELGDVYVNDVKVVFDSGSEGSLRNAQGTRFRNSLYIADHLGGPSQTVDSTLDAASGKWGSSDKLSGMAYTYIRMELKTGEDNAFPNGIPTFTRVVKGRKVYDPRLDSTQTGISGSGSQRSNDSTTWTWSDNWALCVANYITSDFGYGRFGNSWSNINIAELDASADNCDETVNEVFASWSNGETVSEGWRRSVDVYLLKANNDGTTGSTIPDHTGWSVGDTVNDGTVVWTVELASISNTTTRYKLDGIVEADEDPLEVVKEMKGAAAGFIEYIGGSWVITSGRYQAPTITLTESDFAGPITGTSKDDRTRAINGVRGVIANKNDAYNVIDAPPISSAAYVTEDNGVESFRDLKLLYTTSTSAAQRLFKIELLRARQSLAFRSTFTASAFRLKAGDTFSLDFDRYGFSGKVFQVWSTQLKTGGDGELVVDVEFRETASNIYSYTAITDETVVDPAPNTSLPDPFSISNATGLTTTSSSATMIQTGDGTIQPTIHVDWTAAASVNVIGYELRWERFVNQYEYMTLLGREVTSAVIYGVVEDSDYEVQIRSLTPVKTSSWSSVSIVTAVGKSAAPADPSSPTVVAVENGITVSFSEHPDLDFFNYHIWVQTSSSPPTHTGTNPFTPIATTSTSGLTKTIFGLDPSTTYYVFTAAMDSSRLFSDIVATTPATISPLAIANDGSLGELAGQDTVDLTTTSTGGVSGVLPTSNTDATDNGTTIDTSGNIDAEINLNANGSISVGKTNAASTLSGFWLGTDGAGDYDFHIGNTVKSLQWDGSVGTLSITGDVDINVDNAFSVSEKILATGNAAYDTWQGPTVTGAGLFSQSPEGSDSSMGLLNVGAAANTDIDLFAAFTDGNYASKTAVGGERHFDITARGYDGTNYKTGGTIQIDILGPVSSSHTSARSDIEIFPKLTDGTGDSYRFTPTGLVFTRSSGLYEATLRNDGANDRLTCDDLRVAYNLYVGSTNTYLYEDSASVLRTDDLLKVGLGITSYGGIDIDETATAQLRMFNRSNVNDSNDYWDIRHANGGQLQFLYRDNSAAAWDHYTEFMEDGSILIQQNAMRLWNYSSANSDITSLTTGSTFGALIEGDQSGHLVLGIRGNDSSDGVYILKDETNSSGRGSYDTMLLRVDSNVGVQTGNAINLEVQGNTKTNLYHSTLNDGYAYFRYGSSSLVDFQLRVNSGNLEFSVNAGSSWNTIATV